MKVYKIVNKDVTRFYIEKFKAEATLKETEEIEEIECDLENADDIISKRFLETGWIYCMG